MPLVAIKQILLNIYLFLIFIVRVKRSAIWEYVEETVYRKFEIKLS